MDILREREPGYDERLELLGRVLEAGGRATMATKVEALGRVLGEGLRQEIGVGEALVLAGALAVLEPPHVALLAWLNEHRELPPDVALVGGKPAPGWEARELRRKLPELATILDSLIPVLSGQGLIDAPPGPAMIGNGPDYWRVTEFGRRCLFLLGADQ